VPNHSLCGVQQDDERDCKIPVDPDSPFNICRKHYAAIRDHLGAVRRLADPVTRLEMPCPECGVRALLASLAKRTARCDSCGHELDADAARAVNGYASGFRSLPRPATVPPTSVVYYIRFGDRIKIGTTTDLPKRLIALPHDEVLLTEPGSYELEQQRHRQFNRHLIAGREWFEAHPDLLAFITERRAALAAA
jgi:ribosomal protein S27AE